MPSVEDPGFLELGGGGGGGEWARVVAAFYENNLMKFGKENFALERAPPKSLSFTNIHERLHL